MDPYAPCPCGSGKKVKFCCQAILPEMAKIERLQENNQPRMALQLVEKLLKEHPDNGWLVTQRAIALFSDARFEEARDGLVPYLRNHPDHPLANALLALAMLRLEPVEKCKKVIHRAFLKSMASRPQLCALLAAALVEYHSEHDHFMAVRQHMAIALRLGDEEERQRVLVSMLEFDGDSGIPYPLRGSHPLPHYVPREELQAPFKKAQRLFVHGCFSEAADQLEGIAEQDSASGELWHTIGLMRAWDGDESRAADALHKAARLIADTSMAVEAETLAQLMDMQHPDNRIATRMRTFELVSLSRLLTRLDNEDRLVRISSESLPEGMAGSYHVLDRPSPTEHEMPHLTLEQTPRSLGRVLLMDTTGEEVPAHAMVMGYEGTAFDSVVALFESAAGELAKPVAKEGESTSPEAEGIDPELVSWSSREDIQWMEPVFFPAAMPGNVRRQLQGEAWERCVYERWMQSPYSGLGGKSPRDAAGDPALRVPLEAAIWILDAFLDVRGFALDRAALRERLGLEQETKVSASDDLDLNTFSGMQLRHLNVHEMSDELFARVMQRVMVSKHSGHCYEVLSEFLNCRPGLLEQDSQEAMRAFSLMITSCQEALRTEEALEWLARGFEYAKSHGAPFESLAIWKIRELSLRAGDSDDPALTELLMELWNYYGTKMPGLREQLNLIVSKLKIDPPWDKAIVTAGSVSEAAIWTGDAPAASGEKKLWLPD